MALGTDKERRRHHQSRGAGPPPEVFIGCLRGQNDSKLSHFGNLLEKQIMTWLHWGTKTANYLLMKLAFIKESTKA